MKLQTLLIFVLPLTILGSCQKNAGTTRVATSKSLISKLTDSAVTPPTANPSPPALPDSDSLSVMDGTYSGRVFIVGQNKVDANDSIVVKLHGGNFTSIDGSEITTTGTGRFVMSKSVIGFTNLEAFPDNVSVNKSAIFNGTYSYLIKADSLIISQSYAVSNAIGKNGDNLNHVPGSIIYKLKKQ